ncbi:MAG: hypothetical protein RLZZ186_1593, partial [Cyanobacteriota bacterium]
MLQLLWQFQAHQIPELSVEQLQVIGWDQGRQ